MGRCAHQALVCCCLVETWMLASMQIMVGRLPWIAFEWSTGLIAHLQLSAAQTYMLQQMANAHRAPPGRGLPCCSSKKSAV